MDYQFGHHAGNSPGQHATAQLQQARRPRVRKLRPTRKTISRDVRSEKRRFSAMIREAEPWLPRRCAGHRPSIASKRMGMGSPASNCGRWGGGSDAGARCVSGAASSGGPTGF